MNLIRLLSDGGGFEWVPAAGRYRNKATGRWISEAAVRREAERYHDKIVTPRVDVLTRKMLSGQASLSDWQAAMRSELRESWKLTYTAGRGGRTAMTFSDYGKLGSRLRMEYRYLNNFAQEIKDGKLSEAEILRRAKLYAEGARTGYYDGLTAAMKIAEMVEERRILGPAEHCGDCLAYASQGWQPIGTLPEPGEDCACGHNCKCTKEYRTREEA